MMRHSDLVLVVATLDLENERHLLLRRHPKWGDWSLVGGHVEEDEKNDWARAAVRECNEELSPLVYGEDFSLLPLLDRPMKWGPVPSKSAGGELTTYSAQVFALRFLKSPRECLGALPPKDFRLDKEGEIPVPGAEEMSLQARVLDKVESRILAWEQCLSGSEARIGD